jgi:hypothetical protein
VDFKRIRDHIKAGKYRPDLNDENDESLFEADTIADVWPGEPPVKHLHVFVSLPSGMGSPTLIDHGGECFLRLFAPAQDI